MLPHQRGLHALDHSAIDDVVVHLFAQDYDIYATELTAEFIKTQTDIPVTMLHWLGSNQSPSIEEVRLLCYTARARMAIPTLRKKQVISRHALAGVPQ